MKLDAFVMEQQYSSNTEEIQQQNTVCKIMDKRAHIGQACGKSKLK